MKCSPGSHDPLPFLSLYGSGYPAGYTAASWVGSPVHGCRTYPVGQPPESVAVAATSPKRRPEQNEHC